MTVLAAIAALAAATCLGYYLGRRAGATPQSWKKRTSRIALGRLAFTLLVSLTARRVRQRLPAPYLLAPLGLLRAGAARMRAY
jgi:hypothetical protein